MTSRLLFNCDMNNMHSAFLQRLPAPPLFRLLQILHRIYAWCLLIPLQPHIERNLCLTTSEDGSLKCFCSDRWLMSVSLLVLCHLKLGFFLKFCISISITNYYTLYKLSLRWRHLLYILLEKTLFSMLEWKVLVLWGQGEMQFLEKSSS